MLSLPVWESSTFPLVRRQLSGFRQRIVRILSPKSRFWPPRLCSPISNFRFGVPETGSIMGNTGSENRDVHELEDEAAEIKSPTALPSNMCNSSLKTSSAACASHADARRAPASLSRGPQPVTAKLRDSFLLFGCGAPHSRSGHRVRREQRENPQRRPSGYAVGPQQQIRGCRFCSCWRCQWRALAHLPPDTTGCRPMTRLRARQRSSPACTETPTARLRSPATRACPSHLRGRQEFRFGGKWGASGVAVSAMVARNRPQLREPQHAGR